VRALRFWALTGSVGLAVGFVAVAGPANAAGKPKPQRIALAGSKVPARELAHPSGNVAASSTVRFGLVLKLRNAAGAKTFVRHVSTPGSKLFHHYLSDAGWLARFGPTRTEVTKARAWLHAQGFAVGSVPKDRIYISASGTARNVERAFGVKLGYYKVNGHRVRLANGALTIPSSVGGAIAGVVGVNQYVATTSLAKTPRAFVARAAAPAQEPPPPAAFRNPQPCADYWGQKTDTKDAASLYAPFTAPLPYDICGYKPAQLRGAYNLNGRVAGGNDGKGVTVAIVDAYDSPTLLKDAQKYFRLNDPSHPLRTGQFANLEPSTVTNEDLCGASGWFAEQALDVESSHAMAPGANILFVGAQDCLDTSLLSALQTAVTSGASVVSDSWGDTLGDLFADAGTKTAFDNTFMLAASTGVTVLFSSGDSGDNFAISGLAVPDYPATSPFITSVGGTTLEVNKHNARQAEYGWSTARQVLCTPPTARNCGSQTSPAGALTWQAGGGGGTSYTYTQPFYQAGVVPDALALRNQALFGPVPLRVEPDMSMDADAQSGMLIGLTQTFPNGVHYGQFKEGGTSLASPLLAGVVADVDQAAGAPIGFLNPALYKAFTRTPAAFADTLPPANPNSAAVIRVDFANSVSAASGFVISARAINYAGPETYCDGTGNCATRDVTLTTGPGFDGLTGLGSAGNRFVPVMAKF
jgi:subtilase family serine protease